jgi:hypothetical protein
VNDAMIVIVITYDPCTNRPSNRPSMRYEKGIFDGLK